MVPETRRSNWSLVTIRSSATPVTTNAGALVSQSRSRARSVISSRACRLKSVLARVVLSRAFTACRRTHLVVAAKGRVFTYLKYARIDPRFSSRWLSARNCTKGLIWQEYLSLTARNRERMMSSESGAIRPVSFPCMAAKRLFPRRSGNLLMRVLPRWYLGSMKIKTSVTLSEELVALIDSHTEGETNRSAFIELAVRNIPPDPSSKGERPGRSPHDQSSFQEIEQGGRRRP